MPELFGLELAQVDGTSVLLASGEIDLATVALLRESLSALNGRVVVDLSAVSFLGSAGIGVLIGQRNRLTEAEGDLVLRSPEGMVRQALEAVGLEDWIQT
jgi:anti-sigma B factor antagonist